MSIAVTDGFQHAPCFAHRNGDLDRICAAILLRPKVRKEQAEDARQAIFRDPPLLLRSARMYLVPQNCEVRSDAGLGEGLGSVHLKPDRYSSV
jgi:hypothetical protein